MLGLPRGRDDDTEVTTRSAQVEGLAPGRGSRQLLSHNALGGQIATAVLSFKKNIRADTALLINNIRYTICYLIV